MVASWSLIIRAYIPVGLPVRPGVTVDDVASQSLRPVKVSAHIGAPPDKLFAFVSDTRNDPSWCPNVETVELVEGSGVEVGARFRFHQHLDRPRTERIEFDVDVEIIEIEHPSITWKATDKFQERLVKLSIEPEGAGSKITQVTTASFRRRPGLVKWVYPFLARRTFKEQFGQLAAYFDKPGTS